MMCYVKKSIKKLEIFAVKLIMDPQLEEDLAEALGDCDPLELVLQDPLLAEVAEEVLLSCQDDDANVFLCGTEDSLKALSQASPTGSFISSDSSCDNSVDGIVNTPSELTGTVQVKRIFKCVCCDRPARGIYYYGAQVCDSCRAFFGRSIRNEAYKTFYCAENCTESSDRRAWMKCQWCRFDQLCKVGLNIPKRKVTKSSWKPHTQSMFGPNDGTYMYCKRQTELLLISSQTLTHTEKLVVENFISKQSTVAYDAMGRFLKRNEQALHEQLDFLYNGTKIPIRTAKLLLDYYIFSFQEAFREKSSWLITNTLSLKDITRLVGANYPLCHEFLEAIQMNKSYFSSIDMEKEIEVLVNCVTKGLDHAGKETILQIHSKVSASNNNNNNNNNNNI